MPQHNWPSGFERLKQEITTAWKVKGTIDVVRLLSGKSGSTVLAVDIETDSHRGLAILKLAAESDPTELKKHEAAYADGGEYAAHHFPKLVNAHAGSDAMALLFSVAGQSLREVQPFARLNHSQQLEAVSSTFLELTREWQCPHSRDGLAHPADLLQEWLQNKAQPGSRLYQLSEDHLELPAAAPAFSYFGHWLPNPVAWLNREMWGAAESLKTLAGRSHGDLHGDNLLVRVAPIAKDPYYLIDFALYQPDRPLFYDHAYFEISHLLKSCGQLHPERWLSIITALECHNHENGFAGDEQRALEVIGQLRKTVIACIEDDHSDRSDHLTQLFALARVAAGLNFSGKRIDSTYERTLAFIYAAVVLRSHLDRTGVSWEPKGPVLQDVGVPVPPITGAWRQVWDSCDQFDSGRSIYVLVAGQENALRSPLAGVIGRMPWSIVLDFDPESKASGMHASAAPILKTQRALREMVSGGIEPFNESAATAWFFAAGIAARPDTVHTEFRNWRRNALPPIRKLAEDLRDSVAPMPITVLIVGGETEPARLSALWEALDEVFGDQALYVEVGPKSKITSASNTAPNVQTIDCPSDELLRGFWLMYGQKGNADEITLPARSVGDISKTLVTLSVEDSRYLEEDRS